MLLAGTFESSGLVIDGTTLPMLPPVTPENNPRGNGSFVHLRRAAPAEHITKAFVPTAESNKRFVSVHAVAFGTAGQRIFAPGDFLGVVDLGAGAVKSSGQGKARSVFITSIAR